MSRKRRRTTEQEPTLQDVLRAVEVQIRGPKSFCPAKQCKRFLEVVTGTGLFPKTEDELRAVIGGLYAAGGGIGNPDLNRRCWICFYNTYTKLSGRPADIPEFFQNPELIELATQWVDVSDDERTDEDNLVDILFDSNGPHAIIEYLYDEGSILREDAVNWEVKDQNFLDALIPWWIEKWVKTGLIDIDYDSTGETRGSLLWRLFHFEVASPTSVTALLRAGADPDAMGYDPWYEEEDPSSAYEKADGEYRTLMLDHMITKIRKELAQLQKNLASAQEAAGRRGTARLTKEFLDNMALYTLRAQLCDQPREQQPRVKLYALAKIVDPNVNVPQLEGLSFSDLCRAVSQMIKRLTQ